MSANKETLSGVGTVCELGTNYPQAFVPSLSFKTTHTSSHCTVYWKPLKCLMSIQQRQAFKH